jgi:hypothetical protein
MELAAAFSVDLSWFKLTDGALFGSTDRLADEDFRYRQREQSFEMVEELSSSYTGRIGTKDNGHGNGYQVLYKTFTTQLLHQLSHDLINKTHNKSDKNFGTQWQEREDRNGITCDSAEKQPSNPQNFVSF